MNLDVKKWNKELYDHMNSGVSSIVFFSSSCYTFRDDCGYLGVGRAGSIPFVSERPGAYGRLLLAVYVRWKSGLLISSDWLRPVTRGAWRAVLSDQVDELNPTHGPGGSS